MNKIASKVKALAALLPAFAVFAITKVALAISSDTDVPTGTGRTISNLSDPVLVANNIINYALWILGSLSVLLIIYAGFLYILPDDKGEGPKKAKQIITYTIIGIIIVALAGTIVKFVLKIF